MNDDANVTIRRRITAIETAVVAGGIALAIGAGLGVLRDWPFAVALGITFSLGYVLGYRLLWRVF